MKKILIAGALLLVIIIGTGASFLYYVLYKPNFALPQTKYIYIHEDFKDFETLCDLLQDSAGCQRIQSFRMLAGFRNYPQNMKSGRYAIDPGMNNLDVLNRLRLGNQTPVRITFVSVRTIEDLASRLTDPLMIQEDRLLACIRDDILCNSLGFNTISIKTMFIPNTYEVYWNISAEKLMERLKREYDIFWNESRLKKAQGLRLSPVEVSILASIVEEETAQPDEFPIVAGVYINRLLKGWKLEACPTVKFALGDFTLRRILNAHLTIESPYNTYIHEGLPPGPIRIPSIQCIDAVLNYTKHNYMFMCAKEDLSGRHHFAVTLQEHNRNADRYHAELNRRGIR